MFSIPKRDNRLIREKPANVGFSLEDVSIVPRVSDIRPQDVALNTRIACGIELAFPLLPSPMDTVIGKELSLEVIAAGSSPLLHPFYDDDKGRDTLLEALQSDRKNRSAKIGLLIRPEGQKSVEFCARISEKIDYVALDTLHFAPHLHMETIERLKSAIPSLKVISGNVVRGNDCSRVIEAGADAVRVGMTAASINKGHALFGCGRSQGAAILECASAAKTHNIPIISDGGTRDISHAIIALALGASAVMMGRMFAGLSESAAPVVQSGGQGIRKQYSGMSRPNIIDDEFLPEGESTLLEVTGAFKDVLPRWKQLMRIAISRSGAHSIENLHEIAELEWLRA
ncbi:MAG: IMP dehydrogenase [Sulfitobacter sp.]